MLNYIISSDRRASVCLRISVAIIQDIQLLLLNHIAEGQFSWKKLVCM